MSRPDARALVLECQGLLQREFEPRSYMDYIPGMGTWLHVGVAHIPHTGKSWNRATFVRGINGEQEYFSTPIPEVRLFTQR